MATPADIAAAKGLAARIKDADDDDVLRKAVIDAGEFAQRFPREE